MSTYMYLKCMDHDPPIMAREESGQHHYDLPRIRAEIAGRAELVKRWENGELQYRGINDVDNYFPGNSARFLRDHPDCTIHIEDEYGIDRTHGEEQSDDHR